MKYHWVGVFVEGSKLVITSWSFIDIHLRRLQARGVKNTFIGLVGVGEAVLMQLILSGVKCYHWLILYNFFSPDSAYYSDMQCLVFKLLNVLEFLSLKMLLCTE